MLASTNQKVKLRIISLSEHFALSRPLSVGTERNLLASAEKELVAQATCSETLLEKA